ncbi:DNA mismatch repair endonuclease MutL [Legionella sp. 16cNR16C]|uniref:DNA mismatch repair endonuclease MutL n=1 Tax=Legionella sp. 16cNR16C TaxID=2905656 RepID=UPI001E53FED2|nr:DNA mismatch repair endonuclease MutL [Legionella sp. 16cNR16C]MCE3043619.1 DNA mismatch repair endonuclease MutL [Legionella sp. 16cNR16C]
MRIQQLPVDVANQIAAGEVVERPASIVKELLENALDAKATQIAVDIGCGGLNHIKISDNGMGILAEDLPLAIAPHATSKISCLNDLYSITSMGFRGEALASIASVSRLSISSKPPKQAHAMRWESNTLVPCARNQGTTVDVRDIFYNAPVRKKFLKPERIEFQAIDTVLRRFALAAPEIAIQFSHNGKLLLNLMPAVDEAGRRQRIQKILGKSFLDQSIHLDSEINGISLEGFISNVDYQRSQVDKLWIYLNGRIIKDKLLNNAIRQAYEEYLYAGRHPSCLLYLNIAANQVDVNVHPTKHEVRFQQPRLIHDFISSQIAAVLKKSTNQAIPAISLAAPAATYVRESLIFPVIEKEDRLLKQSGAERWYILDPAHAIILVDEKPYLVHGSALQKQNLKRQLLQSNLPLPARPLLVPAKYTVESDRFTKIAEAKELLEHAGIQLVFLSESEIMVSSIPLMLPDLNIKQFLDLFCTDCPSSFSEMVDYLMSAYEFSLSFTSDEMKQELFFYLKNQLMESGDLRGIATHLSEQRCRDLLHA